MYMRVLAVIALLTQSAVAFSTRQRCESSLVSKPELRGGKICEPSLLSKPKLLKLRGGNDLVTKAIVPTIATSLANAMFFSGLPEVISLKAAGSLGAFNPLPMPVIFANCLGWLIYSFLKKDVFIMASNAPGLLLATWYVLTVTRIADPTKVAAVESTHMVLTAVHIATAVGCIFLGLDRAQMTTVYGVLCNIILL
jgi:hypothetical protein